MYPNCFFGLDEAESSLKTLGAEKFRFNDHISIQIDKAPRGHLIEFDGGRTF